VIGYHYFVTLSELRAVDIERKLKVMYLLRTELYTTYEKFIQRNST
jgi:hypothetical protein